jgi:DNA-directed RNA polymerase specialized sigma24 family protein
MTIDESADDEVEDLEAGSDPDVADPSEYRSETELRAELKKLTERDVNRLLGITRNRAIGTPLIGDDLFHTSLVRLLEGRRRWRKDESLGRCIARTVKSLVMDWWRREERVAIKLEADLGEADAAELETAADDRPSALHVLIAREELEAIKAVLKDDQNTLEVAMMLAEGESPKEIREAYGLTQTQYDTVLKRIFRARKKLPRVGGTR